MNAKQHIALACSYLHVPSGYEKAVVSTANLFAQKGHPVTLLILDYTDQVYFPLHPAVRVIHQHLDFGISQAGNSFTRKLKWWKDVRRFGKMIRTWRPDILVCTEYPFTVAAVLSRSSGIKAKLLSWEHHHYYWLKKNRFWKFWSRYSYRRCDRVVCLNNTEEKIYSAWSRTTVIPNFVENREQPHDTTSQKMILTVAGLIHRKGIDLLLETALQVLSQNPDWKWKLIGDGEMKEQVLSFIRSHNLQEQLILQPPAGPVIDHEYKGASLYVMTSRFEAFPLVLLEAMSFGIPCISFDCPSGPSEIISHNKTGVLIPPGDVTALALSVSGLIRDPGKRKEMSLASFERVKQFHPDTIYDRWARLFNEV